MGEELHSFLTLTSWKGGGAAVTAQGRRGRWPCQASRRGVSEALCDSSTLPPRGWAGAQAGTLLAHRGEMQGCAGASTRTFQNVKGGQAPSFLSTDSAGHRGSEPDAQGETRMGPLAVVPDRRVPVPGCSWLTQQGCPPP